MAHATKYRLTFTDTEGNSKELLIKYKDYAGSITDIECSDEPVRFKMEGSADGIFTELKPCSLEISIFSETYGLFSEFENFTELDYLVQYRVNSVLKFTGYIVPLNYSSAYDNGYFFISLTAIDGIGFLKNRQFPVTSGRMSIIDIIRTCLAYTAHSLDIVVANNIYETNQTANRSVEETYFDTAAFAKSAQTAWTCAEVLSEVLKAYTAQLKQSKGFWLIHNIETAYVFPFTAQRYNAAGQRLGTLSVGNVLNIAASIGSGAVGLDEGGNMTKLQPYREAWVKQNYGKKSGAFIGNGDFEKWEYSADETPVWKPVGWTPNGVTIEQVSRADGSALLVYGTAYNAAKYVMFSRTVDASMTPYRVEFEIALAGLASDANLADVEIEITVVNGGTTYYPNSADNDWSFLSQPKLKIKDLLASPTTNLTFYKFSREFNYMPGGTLIVKLFQANIHSGATAAQIYGAVFDNFTIFASGGSASTGVTYIHGTTNSNYNASLENVETIMADIPVSGNDTSIYQNYMSRDVDGVIPTLAWNSSYGINALNVTRLKNILNQYSKPLNKLTIPVHGNVLPDTIVIDHLGVKYLVAAITCNERELTAQIDIIELIEPNTATITISTTDYPDDPDSGSSGTGGGSGTTPNPKDNKVAIADEFGGEMSPPAYMHPDWFYYQTTLGQIHRIKPKTCSGILTGLVSRSVSVDFSFEFSAVPVGRKNIHVYRTVEPETNVFLDQDVLHHSISVSTTGFSLEIDSSEDLTGIIIEYHFIPQTT